MLERTEVAVFLVGNNRELICENHPWVGRVDDSGSASLTSTQYFFSVCPFVTDLMYAHFVTGRETLTGRPELVICFNMAQELIDTCARQRPNALFINFDKSGYADVETCILDYPDRFNKNLILEAKAKVPQVFAALESTSLPKELVSYIAQIYSCVDKVSYPGIFTFFGRPTPPKSIPETISLFALDAKEALEKAGHKLLEEATSLLQRLN